MEACQRFVCENYHFFSHQLSSQTRIFVQLSCFFSCQLWKLVRDLYVQSIIFFLINYLHRLIYLCNHQFFFLTNYLHKLICLSFRGSTSPLVYSDPDGDKAINRHIFKLQLLSTRIALKEQNCQLVDRSPSILEREMFFSQIEVLTQ